MSNFPEIENPPGMANLRKARADDVRILARIHESAFGPDTCWSSADFEGYLKRPGCHAIIRDDVSFILFEVVGDECEIKTLAVMQEFRRRGHAGDLTNEMVRFCQINAVRKVFLEVSKQNEPAISFYIKHGFEEYLQRKDYYKDGSDAILMQRILFNKGL